MLASRSPRRRALLAQAGVEAIGVPAEVEEETATEGPPAGLARANAELKAMAIAMDRPEEIVLGADTIVVFGGEIFGKPRDLLQAAEMLSRMSGQVHEVITGVCLVEWAPRRMVVFHETTRVKFRELTAGGIQDYLASIDPLDKAGAYAAQEDGGRLIERVEGSFSNVVGLPMERTLEALDRHFPTKRDSQNLRD